MTFLAVVNDIDGGAAADNGDFLGICWFVYWFIYHNKFCNNAFLLKMKLKRCPFARQIH